MCRGDSFVGVVYTLVPCLDAKGGVDSSSALTQSQERETNFKSFYIFFYLQEKRTNFGSFNGGGGGVDLVTCSTTELLCVHSEREMSSCETVASAVLKELSTAVPCP